MNENIVNKIIISQLEKEIKELNEDIDNLEYANKENTNEIISLTNIIKEVREYIKEHKRNVYDTFGEAIVFGEMDGIKEILEILDKVGKNNE